MNITKTKEALRILFACEKKSTAFLQGVPGIGKSQIIQQLKEELNLEHLLDIRLSQHENVDIKGMPHIENNVLSWVTPEFMPVKGSKWEGSTGILFFDELNRAQPDVQSSVFEIVQDRRIGMKPILEDWIIVCAGNYGYEDGTDVYEMDSALRNRFVNMEMDKPTISEWLSWANEHNVNSFVTGFLKTNPRYLYQEEEGFLLTPRSWEKFSNILNDQPGKEKEMVLLLGNAMLKSAHNPLYSYIVENEMLSGKDVVEKFEECKEKLDHQERNNIHRINDSILHHIKIMKRINKKHLENVYNYMEGYLTDDNKLSFIIGLRDIGDPGLKFLEKFLIMYEKEYNSENSAFQKLMPSAI